MRPSFVAAFLAALLSAVVVAQQPAPAPASAPAPAPAPKLTDAQMEQFLLHAKVIKTHSASKGITASLRATLSDGKLTHDAQIQAIDEHQQQFNGSAGGVEFDFKDSWAFNVAGLPGRSIDRNEHGAGLRRSQMGLSRRRIHLVDRRCDDGRAGAIEDASRSRRTWSRGTSRCR